MPQIPDEKLGIDQSLDGRTPFSGLRAVLPSGLISGIGSFEARTPDESPRVLGTVQSSPPVPGRLLG